MTYLNIADRLLNINSSSSRTVIYSTIHCIENKLRILKILSVRERTGTNRNDSEDSVPATLGSLTFKLE